MLIRISLIVAVVAGLAVGALNFVKVREKITTLQRNLASETSQKEQAQRDLASTRQDLEKTTSDLTQTRQELETASAERDRAVAAASTQAARANQLSEELNRTKGDLQNAQAELAAFQGTGLTPPQILALSRNLKQAQDNLAGAQEENKVLGKRISKLENELARYRDPEHIVFLPANLKGTVMVSDPKWDFVVLNVGEEQGIVEHGELYVHRNGKLVAKVRVTNVQKDRSIANVLPGNYRLGEVLEGDQVIPAHPAS
jgi:myosin heavy subunit